MITRQAFACASLFLLLLLSCDNGPTTSSGQTTLPYVVTSYPYTQSKDTVKVFIDRNVCNGSLLTHVDTLVMRASFSSDTLFLKHLAPLTGVTGDSSILVLVRRDTGAGLNGSWWLVGTMESDTSALQPYATYDAKHTVDFVDGSMTTRSSMSIVEGLYQSLGGSLSGFDITIAKIGSAVRLTGNVTGEIVTIDVVGNEELHYTSSDPTNTPYIYYNNPTECPNARSPSWLLDFYLENARLSKRATYFTCERAQDILRSLWAPF